MQDWTIYSLSKNTIKLSYEEMIIENAVNNTGKYYRYIRHSLVMSVDYLNVISEY